MNERSGSYQKDEDYKETSLMTHINIFSRKKTFENNNILNELYYKSIEFKYIPFYDMLIDIFRKTKIM